MNSRYFVLAALAAGVIAAGCEAKKEEAPAEAAAPPPPAVDVAAEEQAIRNRSGEWMNYANAKDSASIVNNLYAPDAVAIFNNKARKGSESIKAGMDADMKDMPNALISWSSDKVHVASSGDLAYETGSFNLDPDGDGKKPAVQGTFVTVWTKVDGQWRAVADAGAENAPAAVP